LSQMNRENALVSAFSGANAKVTARRMPMKHS
jgi:hypothetical protein